MCSLAASLSHRGGGRNASGPLSGPTISSNIGHWRNSWGAALVDIDLLRTFVAICETRSFTAAARHVGRTQSAVSLQMRRLEESLDRPLFFRGPSSVTLTEHGELLYGHALEILAGVDKALAAFDRSSPAGIVMIGLPDDYAPRVLPFILDCTKALLPHVTVDIVLDESKTLARHLAEARWTLPSSRKEKDHCAAVRWPSGIA